MGVTGQQEILTGTPSRHLIPPAVCPGVRVSPLLGLVFFTRFVTLIAVRYLHLFILWILSNLDTLHTKYLAVHVI